MTLVVLSVVGGMFCGILSTVLGLGGGILLVPLLRIYFGVPFLEAVATSLVVLLFISSINTLAFWRRGDVDWTLAFLLSLGAPIGSWVGGFLVDLEPELLEIVFLALIAVVWLRLWLPAPHGSQRSRKVIKAFVSAFGVIGGVVATVTGLGAGSVLGPLMILLGVSPRKLPGILNVGMLGIVASSLVSHSIKGTLTVGSPSILIAVMAGFFLVAPFGWRLQSRISGKIKQRLYAIVLTTVLSSWAWHLIGSGA